MVTGFVIVGFMALGGLFVLLIYLKKKDDWQE